MIEIILILALGYTLAWAFENQDKVKALWTKLTSGE